MADPTRNDRLAQTFISQSKTAFPGYELVELIGRGAMGEVWRARQVSLGRAVALKKLPENLASDPEFVSRFEKEATALAALSHPNIVQIIDRGVVEGRYFFAMELVQGKSLRERLREGPVSCAEALRIVRQLCEAVGFAHDSGVVHRDLKPENILLDERGYVKVADFGLAGIRGQETAHLELTATSVAMGTLNYMAPEQRRDAKRVDGRADLYSLGVIFYELLTQDLPLGRFKAPSERVKGLDPRLDPVVMKLLEQELDARTATAAEVEQAIRPVLAGMESAPSLPPTSATPSSPSRPRLGDAPTTLIRSGVGFVRKALLTLGALTVLGLIAWSVLGFSVRRNGSELDLLRNGKVVLDLDHHTQGELSPSDEAAARGATERILNVSGRFTEVGTAQALNVHFDEGGPEAIHARAGDWQVVGGALRARQLGDGPGGPLIPRAYVDDRIFSTDGFTASVVLTAKALPQAKPDDPKYAELALRFSRLQVSLYADPDTGMRVSWKYRSTDGSWPRGSTQEQVANGTDDEVHLPLERPGKLELSMKTRPNGTLVTASYNGRRISTRLLEGLSDMPGKVALGCRNMECTFSDLNVTSAKPAKLPKLAAHQGED